MIIPPRPRRIQHGRGAVGAVGAKPIAGPQLVHCDGWTELWMAFVADPDGIPVGLMEEREPAPPAP